MTEIRQTARAETSVWWQQSSLLKTAGLRKQPAIQETAGLRKQSAIQETAGLRNQPTLQEAEGLRNQPEWLEQLSTWEIFDGFSIRELEAFHACGYGRRSVYRQGDVIRPSDGRTMPVSCILSGTVEICRMGSDGTIRSVMEVGTGEYLGLSGITNPRRTGLYEYTAGREAVLYSISRECFAGGDHPDRDICGKLSVNLNRILAREMVKNEREREILTAPSTRDKILLYLDEQRLLAGKDEFTIPHTREQLAEYMHVNRTALSREIGQMVREGILKTQGKSFRICADKMYSTEAI